MSVNDGSTVSRQFVASPGRIGLGPNWSAKRSYIYVYGVVALFALPAVAIGMLEVGSPHTAAKAGVMVVPLIFLFGVSALAVFGVYYWRHSRRQILICVTSDGLTVNQRPGDVFFLQ
jgi:hypothetical protein